jgi:tetratricopeptide (TPR) repeat protein
VFDALPPGSPAALGREFCVATAELSASRISSARIRYERVVELLKQPLDMVPRLKENLRQGCLHGLAQCAAESDDELALELADLLEHENPSFAAHAETVRVGYYVARGDAEDIELHRARAETLALLGGVSWSATSVLTVRCVYASALTGDAFGLVRALADLERACRVSEPLALFYRLAQAHLDHLRGQHDAAIAVYEQILDGPGGKELPTHKLDCALYGAALCLRGDLRRAHAVCLSALASAEPDLSPAHRSVRPLQQALALAEAQLGEHAQAAARLERCLAAQGTNNPFALGVLHRDRAYVALYAGDQLAFAEHAAAAETQLRAIRNPTLIAQLETLFTQAARAGFMVRPTSVEARGSSARERRVDDAADDAEDLGTTIVEGTPLKQTLPKRLQ